MLLAAVRKPQWLWRVLEICSEGARELASTDTGGINTQSLGDGQWGKNTLIYFGGF